MPNKARQLGRKRSGRRTAEVVKVCTSCQALYQEAGEIFYDLKWTMIFDGMSKIIRGNSQSLRHRAKAHLALIEKINQGQMVEISKLEDLSTDLHALAILADTRAGVINNQLVLLKARRPYRTAEKRKLHATHVKKLTRMLRRAAEIHNDIMELLMRLTPSRPMLIIVQSGSESGPIQGSRNSNGTPQFSEN